MTISPSLQPTPVAVPVASISLNSIKNTITNSNTLNELKGMDLSSNALLVKVTIGQPTRTVQSQLVRDAAAKQTGASVEHLRGGLQVMPDDAIALYKDIVREARSYSKSKTTAWDDQGYRLLPTARYGEYRKQMDEYERQYLDAAQIVLSRYDEFKAQYEAAVVDPEILSKHPFPAKPDLQTMFQYKISTDTIQSPGDIRLNSMSSDVQEQFRAQLQAEVEERAGRGVSELVERVTEILTRVENNCGSDDGPIFDSMTQSIKEVTPLVAEMAQILDSRPLQMAASQMVDRLSGISTEALRNNPDARQNAAKSARSIRESLMEADLG